MILMNSLSTRFWGRLIVTLSFFPAASRARGFKEKTSRARIIQPMLRVFDLEDADCKKFKMNVFRRINKSLSKF
jgi:hypothetical protein